MYRSIMMNLEVEKCYICGKEGPTEAHHCLHGSANRRLAERDGLIVNLCPECHRRLHEKGTGDDTLMEAGQLAWENYNLSDTAHFMARYGKNFKRDINIWERRKA